MICVTNITENGIDFSSFTKYISEEEYLESYQHFTVKKGDLLLASSGASWGKVAEYESDEVVILNTSTIRLNSQKNKINRRFLRWLLSSNYINDQLSVLITGSCQPNFGPTHLSKLEIAIPESELDQQKIVNFLDYKTGQCDRFISNRQKQIELLNEQKATIINKAVTKGINPNAKMKPSDIEWIGDIPEHWKVKRPASFGRFSKGSGISKSDLVENGVPVILYGDIYTKYNLIAEHIFNFISQELASNSKPIYKGDLLFTGSGETREDIGKCIVYNGETKAYAGGDLMIFRQKSNSSLFLAYSFSTNYAITKKAMNSRGDIIIHIYASALRDIYIPIPSLSEQQGIIDFIKKETSKIETLISKYQKQIELMQEYRTTLISQAVTGKIDVRDWKPPTK
ncbi:MAG: restriction endonuclease subunit S [Planktothrix agardhii KL2]|nr:restriction endonuclease subunit S [Planktothrix agardhii KL2]